METTIHTILISENFEPDELGDHGNLRPTPDDPRYLARTLATSANLRPIPDDPKVPRDAPANPTNPRLSDDFYSHPHGPLEKAEGLMSISWKKPQAEQSNMIPRMLWSLIGSL